MVEHVLVAMEDDFRADPGRCYPGLGGGILLQSSQLELKIQWVVSYRIAISTPEFGDTCAPGAQWW